MLRGRVAIVLRHPACDARASAIPSLTSTITPGGAAPSGRARHRAAESSGDTTNARAATPESADAAQLHAGPRRGGLLRRLGWWIADYAYALRWQARALWDRSGPRDFLSGSGCPVVVIPGVYEPWRFMLPLIRRLHRDGHPVHVLDPLRNNRVPVVEGARIVDDYLAAAGLADVVLLAHSKGGLIGKHVMAFGRQAERVRGMVAVAAPFGGSRYARYLLGRTLRAFSPVDPTIVLLAEAPDANSRIVSVYARFDPHIPEGSELAGARNVPVDTGGHFRILANVKTVAAVREAADHGWGAPGCSAPGGTCGGADEQQCRSVRGEPRGAQRADGAGGGAPRDPSR
ncbi:alpha/beta hydrolase [Leucobacter chromiiresistens]|uniref:esterase/lipase family protein n=1 Tax=Leucobacter chromiiresistens TaxID=1079994 RepID=UPI002F2B58FE